MSAPAADPRQYDYSRPERECDIVMKGGITSGVVYPHAICELAQTYRLVNVGGTSAGAIAAAAAGAAEAGRASGGYKKLAELPDWLGAGTNLLSLFQPQEKTKRLFSVLVASLGRGGKVGRVTAALLRGYWVAALVGALLGVLIVGLAIWLASGAGLVLAAVAGVLVAAVGAVGGIGVGVYRDLLRVPDNCFGLCSGLGDPGPPALTPWLADLIDELAGREKTGSPFTFAELEQAGVHLELMTTNLTQRRPLRLPWVRPELFFFDPAALRQLFPERVIQHLERNPPPDVEDEAEARDWRLLCWLLEPLRPLPLPANLPIVVGARLSLSFPLLLSAIPLHAIDWSRKHNQEAIAEWRTWLHDNPDGDPDGEGAPARRPYAEMCWFSDGGISSNFPIHFFDAPLPRRPTFAINLRGFHPDYPQSSDESQNVYLPERSVGGLLEWWYRYPDEGFGRLKGFGESIVRTMQNRVDEAQMRAPGYRDRVVHVSTSEVEGGMNLNMPTPVIDSLTARGRAAARRLLDRFARPPQQAGDLSWDSHRWTRYRSSIAAIADLLVQVRAGYQASSPQVEGERTYAQLIQRAPREHPRAYQFVRAAQRNLAKEFTEALVGAADVAKPLPPEEAPDENRPPEPELPPEPAALIAPQEATSEPEDLAEGAPRPQPEARIVPRA